MNSARAALLAAAAVLPGCVVTGSGLDVSDTVVESRRLDPDGEFSLENTNGRVVVEAWDEPEVKIEAERRAVTRSRLEDIRIDVVGEGDRVSVETRLPRAWFFGATGQVDYRVSVPRGAQVSVETVNGRVTVSGVAGGLEARTVNGSVEVMDARGPVDASTVNGSIRAEYAQAAVQGRHRFETTNGKVTLELPADVRGEFSASTVNGGIRTDFPLEVGGRFGGKRLKGRLGDDGGSFEVSTVNGAVRIQKS